MGLGFASALNEIGLPPNKFFLSIFSFNVGVELGQITVILTMFALIIIPFRKIKNYKRKSCLSFINHHCINSFLLDDTKSFFCMMKSTK